LKGPRALQQQEREHDARLDDVALIQQLEVCELGYQWERDLLEQASRRV
jgi:hypothetical protein